MHFRPLILDIGIHELAVALQLPPKNVRRWVDNDSIPAEWFKAVSQAARRLGHRGISVSTLAEIAEQKRLSKAAA